jgi:hypothetical protein
MNDGNCLISQQMSRWTVPLCNKLDTWLRAVIEFLRYDECNVRRSTLVEGGWAG